MSKISSILLMAAVLVLASCGSTSGVQFSPKKGDSYRYMANSDMDINVQGMSIEMNMKYYYTYKVEDKLDTAYVLSMKYDSMSMTQVNPMSGTVKYNSNNGKANNEAAKQLDEAFKSMQKADIKIWLSKNGKVIKKEGTEEIEGAGQGMMQGGGVSNTADQNFITFPQKEIKEGTTWSTTNESAFGLEMTTHYTVSSISDDDVNLDVKVEGMKNKEVEIQNMPVRIKSTESSGNLVVDKATGMVKSFELDQKMEMEMEAQGMKMDMVNDSKTTIKQLD